mgnify:FL=1
MAAKISNISDAASRKKLVETFDKAGWDISRPIGELHSPMGGPTIYIGDVSSGRLYVVTLVVNGVELLQNQLRKSGLSYQDICDALGSLVSDLSTDKVPFNLETQSALVSGAVLYIAGTKSYEISTSSKMPNPQFIVLRYMDYSTGDHLLRPLPISSPDPLTPAEVEEYGNLILDMDRKNHPGRFKSAKVLPFVIKQRFIHPPAGDEQ